MKKLLLVLLSSGLCMCTGSSKNKIGYSSTNKRVYICVGKYAEVYHSDSECYGLKSCGCEIENVLIEEAENMGRRACKICY